MCDQGHKLKHLKAHGIRSVGFCVFGLLLIGTVTALALYWHTSQMNWRIASSEQSAISQHADFLKIRFENKSGAHCDVTVVHFNRMYGRVELVDLPGSPTNLQSLKKLLDNNDCTTAINGGYFDGSFSPVGLRIFRGAVNAPAISRPPLSGFISINDKQVIDVTKVQPAAALYALQTGPFVIDPGGIVGINPSATSTNRRTVIAVADNDVFFLITSDLSLFDLANILHDLPGAFGVTKIDRAINLDGGPSTGMAVRLAQTTYCQEPTGPIREAISLHMN